MVVQCDHTITPTSPDFYHILGIHPDVSLNDIKIAYHHTLLRHHPDKQPQLRCSRTARVMVPSALTTRVEDEGISSYHHHHHHPTIQSPGSSVVSARSLVADMALVKEAYETLSNARLRAVYDRSMKRGELEVRPQPRPAQVISLEEFTVVEVSVVETVMRPSRSPPGSERGTGTGMENAEALALRQEWHHRCRCGGTYRITEDDLENGTHLVGCESCSEVICVGYEAVTEDEEGSNAEGLYC